MEHVKAYRIVIYGRVQGVGFRYFAYHKAQNLGLVGTVKNLPDGCVEVFVQGEDDLISQFKELLHVGPSYSRIDEIKTIEDIPDNRLTNFNIIH